MHNSIPSYDCTCIISTSSLPPPPSPVTPPHSLSNSRRLLLSCTHLYLCDMCVYMNVYIYVCMYNLISFSIANMYMCLGLTS